MENAREFILNLANSSTEPPPPRHYDKHGIVFQADGTLPIVPQPHAGTASVIAPCPHSFKCPLQKFGPRGKMRCTFLQQPPPSPVAWVRERFPRGRLGLIGYEHSYVAITKMKKGHHIELKSSTDWPDARIIMLVLAYTYMLCCILS